MTDNKYTKYIKENGIPVTIFKGTNKLFQKGYCCSNYFYTYFKLKKTDFGEEDINSAIEFSYNCLDLMQIKWEIKNLLKIIKQEKPKYIMEIGSAKGGTLFLFSKVADPYAHIISLDLPHGNFGGGYSKSRIPIFKKLVLKTQTIDLIRDDSHKKKTLNQIKKILGKNKLDFLFIDGDHTYNGVKKDFEMYSPLVKKGGIIAFHDIAKSNDTSCKVNTFWNQIKKKYKSKEIIEDKEQGGFGIGVLYYQKKITN